MSQPIKLNCTEVHLCHRCPRLLAYQLQGRGRAWKTGLQGSGNFPSKIFHNHIAKPFHDSVCQGPNNVVHQAVHTLLQQQDQDIKDNLFAILNQHILDPLLAEKAATLKADQIIALVEGMSFWNSLLTDFLDKCRNHHKHPDLSALFCRPEQKFSTSIPLGNGSTVQLTGQFDGLLIDQQRKEAVIIEFKGLKPAHTDEDLIQVALYAALLKANTGIMARAMVLYLEEEDKLATYPAETLAGLDDNLKHLLQIAATTKQIVQQGSGDILHPPNDPQLCSVCSFAKQCDQDWGDRTAVSNTKPVPPSPTQKPAQKPAQASESKPHPVDQSQAQETQERENTKEAEDLLQLLTDTLKAIHLPVQPEGYVLGPRLIRLKIKPLLVKGTTVSKIERRASDLQIALSTKVPPLIQTGAGHMTIDIPRKISTPLTLSEVWERGQDNKPDEAAAFPVGMAVDGTIFWAKLSKATMTSILVAGTAGSGKSIFLRSAILGMARNAGPEQLRFTLIDPKLVSFTDLNDLPHLDGQIIYDIEPALEALEELVTEMERRYQLFADAKVFDIEEYCQTGKEIPHHVVVIDEYADLMVDKNYKQEAELCIQRLCQKGRAAGFHVILSTQRPDAKVVTPLIKANLQLKIALKVTTSTNSNVILDTKGAENLMGNGDMLVGGAVPLIRLQGPLATKSDFMEVGNS
ncbi:MAG: Dna2/Cas4 domain-containing protein [Candidatus Electrothrix sp. AS4_5]|nr:Dna2/Cas4 domain-containing protein [Candidatus Electrothrix gigas]